MQPEQPSQPQRPNEPQSVQSGGSFSRTINPINDVVPAAAPAPEVNTIPSAPPAQPAPIDPTTAPPPTVNQQQLVTAEDSTPDVDLASEGNQVSWVAHEYIDQERGTMWFTAFGVVVLALIGLSIWMQWWTFVALLVVITVVIIVYTRRPPHELTYVLDDDGLSVDGKLYSFESFKSFGVIKDGEHYSVMLIPTQRLQPGLTVYFPEDSGEKIVDMLGAYLPMKEMKLDAVDRVVRMLRL